MHRRKKAKVFMLGIMLLAIALAGCATERVIQQPEGNLEQILAGKPYVIGLGDQLSVQVWRNQELSVSVIVRPDGMISVPLVGDVAVLNKEPMKLASEIAEKLGSFIRSPEVTVIVLAPTSAVLQYQIRIAGAVNQPVSVPYQKGMTVFDVVQAAGGLSPFAAANRAVLRRKVNGKQHSYQLKLEDMFTKGQFETNFSVLPGDLISVPKAIF